MLAFVSWPEAPLTEKLVRHALSALEDPPTVVSSIPEIQENPLLQWATYDEIDHGLTNDNHQKILSAAYIVRKALIRKHYLASVVRQHMVKNPTNLILKEGLPHTYEIELSFADELDELFCDELWELGEELEDPQKWWILKPYRTILICHNLR